MKTETIALLIALALAFGMGWHFGRQGLELKDTKQLASSESATIQKTSRDQVTVAGEAKTYEDAIDPLAPIPGPIVRLCIAAPAVPSAHPAGPGAHAAAAVRAADPQLPAVVDWDSKPVVRQGRVANAQVAGLQDYITHVCQAHAP